MAFSQPDEIHKADVNKDNLKLELELKTASTEASGVSAQLLSNIKNAEVMEKNKLTFIDEEGNPVESFLRAKDVVLNGENVQARTGFSPRILVINEIYGQSGHTFYAFKENGDPILQGGEFNRFCTNSRLSAFCNVGFGARNSEKEENVDIYNYDGELISTLTYQDSDFDYSIIQTVQAIVSPGISNGKNLTKDFIELYDKLINMEQDSPQKLENLSNYQQKEIDTFKKLIGPLKKYVR